VFPSLPLPPIPPLGMTREEIAAALREDFGAMAGHDPVAAPASPPATPAPRAPQPPQTAATATQPVPPAAQPAGPRSASGPPRLTRPVISAAPLPDPGPPRGLGALRYARRVVPGTRPLVQPRDPRRRAGGYSRGLQTRTRSDGGASAFFTIMLITFAILLYFIISGLLAAFARLIP
jgi:hypothetical protein